MGAFQTSDCNTNGYYIVQWTGNAYTLQEKNKCHAFNPPVIIPEGEIVCLAKFITPMKKLPYVIEPETCKYSSILRGYNKWYITKLNLKKETTNPNKMKIK